MYCKRRKSGVRFPDKKEKNRLCACHCIAGHVIRYHMVQVRQNLKKKDLSGWRPTIAFPYLFPSFILFFALLPCFLKTKVNIGLYQVLLCTNSYIAVHPNLEAWRRMIGYDCSKAEPSKPMPTLCWKSILTLGEAIDRLR